MCIFSTGIQYGVNDSKVTANKSMFSLLNDDWCIRMPKTAIECFFAYFLIMNNKKFSWKNCYSPTLKFKLEREISWWQTHKLIILIIIEWTARLRLEIYLETGWDVQTCYSHHTEIWNTYAMKSSLFSWGDVYRSNAP